ncbi:MAG: topoisomerase DNA-binding C4 zinc finger domain-containing protein, partial [Candidatus Bathyarchaeota archaeon]
MCLFEAQRCPQCRDGYLIERFSGTKFLGCSNYPN